MKKIMFADRFALTQAVLNGTKTQTRRLVLLTLHRRIGSEFIKIEPNNILLDNERGWSFELDGKTYPLPKQNHPKFQIGEIVAVAQSYERVYAEMIEDWAKHHYHAPREDAAEIFRRDFENTSGWDNKMFVRADLMPHQIRITNLRVQHLQDITDEECAKEGIRVGETTSSFWDERLKDTRFYPSPREAYADLIDRINGRGTWEINPYVFVCDFELIK